MENGHEKWTERYSITDIYNAYFPAVVRHVTHVLKHDQRGDADAIADDCFLKLREYPDVQLCKVKSWLFTTGTRMAIDSIRWHIRRPSEGLEFKDRNGEMREKAIIDPRFDAERTEEYWNARREELAACLSENFKEWEQKIFDLYLNEGRNYIEIADTLEMDVQMVTKQIYRLTSRMKTLLRKKRVAAGVK
jgi:RNA polymerase sigma factor (sigma-70 family)